MAKSLASLRRVKAVNPPRFIAYGVHGIGKTSFAAEWPDPVFIQCEQGTPGGIEIDSFGEIETFDDVLGAMESLLTERHEYKTVVIDSLDAMEPMVWSYVCKQQTPEWANIETPGWGKGFKIADSAWLEFIARMNAMAAYGMAVVMIAHSEVKRFDSPTSDPYSRYLIKLHERAGALVQEHADIVGFFNYRISIKEKEVGFNKKVSHGVGGGSRLIHLEERAGFLAKNRYQMPESVEYRAGKGYEAIAKYFPQPTGISTQVQQAAE
jgi:hypothetical protein